MVGQADAPPLPGLSSSLHRRVPHRQDGAADHQCLVRRIGGATLAASQRSLSPISRKSRRLTTLTLNVVDPVNSGSADVSSLPASVIFHALNPDDGSEYQQLLADQHQRQRRRRVAVYRHRDLRADGSHAQCRPNTYVLAYNGQINLTFLPWPARRASTSSWPTPPSCNTPASPTPPATRSTTPNVAGEGTKDFIINFDVQPQPVYITSMALESSYNANGSTVIGTEQSYFELPPAGGANTRDNVPAPPDGRRHRLLEPAAVRLVERHADQLRQRRPVDRSRPTARAGHPTAISATWAKAAWEAPARASPSSLTTRSPSTTTTSTTQTWSLVPRPAGRAPGWCCSSTAGTHSPADDYRVYIPNQVEPAGVDTAIYRHLRQPARRRKPRQPDLADQPRLQQSRRAGDCPEYEDLQIQRHLSHGRHERRRRGRRRVHGRVHRRQLRQRRLRTARLRREPAGARARCPTAAWPIPTRCWRPKAIPARRRPIPTHNPNGGLNSTFFLPARQLQHGLRFQRRRQVRAIGPLRGLAVDVCLAVLGRRSGRRRRLAGHSPAQPDHRRDHASRPSCFRLPPATTAA